MPKEVQFCSSMETIYHSRFAKHDYEAVTRTLFTEWFEETKNMNSQEFREEMLKWLEVFQKTKPQYLYDYCVPFAYPINPGEQFFMAQLLNVEWIKLGLKKYAHIVPSDMITEISVEQTFEEFFSMNLPNQFPIVNFTDRQSALKWLYQP